MGMQSKTNKQQNVRRQVPIPLDQAEPTEVQRAYQTGVAPAANKALQGRIDEQIAFPRSLSWLRSID